MKVGFLAPKALITRGRSPTNLCSGVTEILGFSPEGLLRVTVCLRQFSFLSSKGHRSPQLLDASLLPTYRAQMIKLALLCLVIAAVAAILGFGGLAGTMVDVAIVLAVIAALLFVVFLLLGIFAGKKAKDLLD
tara:strand:- start:578 stop:976 length:399 start_codon:yes stop_codon:yes gene_type:complete